MASGTDRSASPQPDPRETLAIAESERVAFSYIFALACISPMMARSVQRREPCGEVPQLPGLGHDAHAGQLGGPAGHPGDDFDHVVEVALGVGTARDGETDQVHRGRGLGAVGCRPNMTVPISQARNPPSAYRAQASAWPG